MKEVETLSNIDHLCICRATGFNSREKLQDKKEEEKDKEEEGKDKEEEDKNKEEEKDKDKEEEVKEEKEEDKDDEENRDNDNEDSINEEYDDISNDNQSENIVTCAICNKSSSDINNFICVTPGLYFCVEDYEKYKKEKLPEPVLTEYCNKMIENMKNELFNPMIHFCGEVNPNGPSENVFIDSYMIENSYSFCKYYKYFIPTVTFHLKTSLKQLNLAELAKALHPKATIVCVERGSVFLTIAFIMTGQLTQTKQDCLEVVNLIKATLGESIIGTYDTEINIPGDENNDNDGNKGPKEIFKDQTINFLQNPEIIEKIDFNKVRDEVLEILQNQQNKNWNKIFEHIDLFESAEEQVYEDIRKNEIELIIIGETIIANKYFEEYNNIKQEILKEIENKDEYKNVKNELFLYHGSSLKNHLKIIKSHFYSPNTNIPRADGGYFGRGVYATDNIFYAAMYTFKPYRLLNFDDSENKGYVFCCQAIFHPKHIKVIQSTDEEREASELPIDPNRKYGMNKARVGSANAFHFIEEEEEEVKEEENKEKSLITANEFVFPNEHQIVPICSFTVMRTKFYFLWADENGTFENSDEIKDLKKTIIQNVYYESSLDAIKEIVNIKKRNKIKLILTFQNDRWGTDVINEIRKILGKNIVCLIYSKDNIGQIKIAKEMENVLFTNKKELLLKFAQQDLTFNNMQELRQTFEDDLKKQMEFNINESSILDFSYIGEYITYLSDADLRTAEKKKKRKKRWI